jgi:2-hydroxychromene-2-carboxylate isomerase
MTRVIDYFFTTVSPFSYLGHDTLHEIARQHHCSIRYRPFSLAGVWEKSGSVPLAKRSATRQRYRFIELQRVAWQRGVKINLRPKHFPADPQRADLCCAALVLANRDAGAFARKAGEAIWSRDLNISDEAVLAKLLAECGEDADQILLQSRAEPAAAERTQNTQDAIALDAIGAPSYAYKGEIFWGQDRLEMLEAMIVSDRAPFSSPAL